MAQVKYDVAVIGGGPAGLSTALALSARLGKGAKIALVEGAPARLNPARVFALAPATQRFLAHLGAWPQNQASAAPVLAMAIMDGEPDDPIRRTELNFSGSQEAPLAHITPADSIADALRQRLLGAEIARVAARMTRFDGAGAIAKLALDDGQGVDEARLAVAADGGESLAREAARISSVEWSYKQIAIVATIDHARPHDGVAEQVFFPAGPFATLPLPGNCSSIVWSENASKAEDLLSGPREDFMHELEKRFPARLGDFSLTLPPQSFPLAFRLARRFVAARLALVGDAAHSVQSAMAGTGLDLGLTRRRRACRGRRGSVFARPRSWRREHPRNL